MNETEKRERLRNSKMSALDRIEEQAKNAAKRAKFRMVYHPGETEESDYFEAVFDDLSVSCFGPTERHALKSAQADLAAKLMANSKLRYELLGRPFSRRRIKR